MNCPLGFIECEESGQCLDPQRCGEAAIRRQQQMLRELQSNVAVLKISIQAMKRAVKEPAEGGAA